MSYEENRAKVLSLFESVQGGENSESENGLDIDNYNTDKNTEYQ